mmetsp:Transcript_11185/g.38881  ORF Transcript_11185/g.38881 Transcript_11185/m.38881 type:complete len:100 (+) Transcript_11185:99-398(+)
MATTESKKESFRKYLENAGVIDSLTKVLVALYEEPEKPQQALEFLMNALGGKTPADFEAVVAEKEALATRVSELEEELLSIKSAQEAEAAPDTNPANNE